MKIWRKGFASRNAIVAIVVLSVLVFSGNSIATNTHSAGGSSGSVVKVHLGNPPSYAGPAAKFLTGPIKVTPTLGIAATPAKVTAAQMQKVIHIQNPKILDTRGLAAVTPNILTLPSTLSCQPRALGCDTISSTSGGAVSNPIGVNAANLLGAYGTTVEPPDQSICAGAGFAMQVENIGELRVFNQNFGSGTAVMTLDNLMGLTGMGWSSGGDISCLYDYDNGGHWFITEFVSTTPEAAGGTFVGCFAGLFDGCLEGIAVSVTNNPTGAWNVYFLDPNAVNTDPGVGFLLNDFVKIGNTHDAFLLSYDEFNLNGSLIPACPAFGCFGLNGAQQIAISKNALELGYPVSEPFGGPDPLLNVVTENMGFDPTIQPPDGGQCGATLPATFVCWFQAIPAMSPDPAQFDNSWGGSGFIVASLDFFGAGDTRMAVFDWTGLSALNSNSCSTCSGIAFGSQILSGVVGYLDEGANCPASTGGFCGLAAQKVGPIPLGDNCAVAPYLLNSSPVAACPEGGIATNGDGVTQVNFAGGQIWSGVSTLVNQKFGKGACGGTAECELHVGAVYTVIGTAMWDAGGPFTLTDTGMVAAAHEDMEFPAIAAGGTGYPAAVMAFTLSGDGGPTAADHGGFFPSTAYVRLSLHSHGALGDVINIADKGKAPQDGFTEYQGFPGATRPRWGDYNAAIFMPTNGGRFYFATEFIQYPACSDATFLVDPTCGGTRAPFGNWGDSMNYLP